jgi:uncharacterized protein YndB with AHSA1/START domain
MSVSVSEIIDAPIDRVWRLIADFANLPKWHPLVVRCEMTGEGEGAMRVVHFADWWATERLDRLDHAAHVLAYSVVDASRPPAIGVSGTIALTRIDDDRTRIDWSSGQKPEHPAAAEVNAGLAAYYPARIGHLRTALGLA